MPDDIDPTYHVTCPGCARTLHVPSEAVGKTAHCPHCKANFLLPANPDGTPGEPRESRGKVRINAPRMVLAPGFALLAVGMIGVVVNGILLGLFLVKPGADLEYARGQVRALRSQEQVQTVKDEAKRKDSDPPLPEPPDTSAADDEIARSWATVLVPVHAASLGLSLLTVAGGVAMLAGRWYPLAILGCLAGAVNVNNLCCVPGGAAGLWAFLTLIRDEGRRHFGK